MGLNELPDIVECVTNKVIKYQGECQGNHSSNMNNEVETKVGPIRELSNVMGNQSRGSREINSNNVRARLNVKREDKPDYRCQGQDRFREREG